MFSKLIGNNHIKLTLKRLIASDRLPNSLLFAGDEGVGKRQFALEIAKALVCTEPADIEACGVCSACRRAAQFTFPKSDKGEDFEKVFFSEHLDVGTVIAYKRNIRIKAIRDLEREANFQPYEAKARFFLIDDAEKMADPSANALLKTLEEPPPTSHLFLITSQPDSLLPTIRSRCQMLRFAPIATAEIEKFLIEDRAFTHDEARLAARLARGSIGRALGMNVGQFRKRREKMLSVVEDVLRSGDIAALFHRSEELNDAKNKDDFEENIDVLQSVIHDIWATSLTSEPARIVNSDLAVELGDLAQRAVRADLALWLAEIDAMRENFTVNINRKVATDALFVSMTA